MTLIQIITCFKPLTFTVKYFGIPVVIIFEPNLQFHIDFFFVRLPRSGACAIFDCKRPAPRIYSLSSFARLFEIHVPAAQIFERTSQIDGITR